MKPISKRLLTILLALMVLSFFVGEVQAAGYEDEDDSLIVSIESADYLDLDGDLLEDDIITEFTISVPIGDWEFDRTYVYCEIILPSGIYFNCILLVIGTYSSFTLTLGWYNTALESGWYTFNLFAWGRGDDAPEMRTDSLVFDPPTDGLPALPPSIEIIDISAE